MALLPLELNLLAGCSKRLTAMSPKGLIPERKSGRRVMCQNKWFCHILWSNRWWGALLDLSSNQKSSGFGTHSVRTLGLLVATPSPPG